MICLLMRDNDETGLNTTILMSVPKRHLCFLEGYRNLITCLSGEKDEKPGRS